MPLLKPRLTEQQRLTQQALTKPPGVDLGTGRPTLGNTDYTRPGTTQAIQNPNIAGDAPYQATRDAQNGRLAEAKIEARRAGRGAAPNPTATAPDPARVAAQQRFDAKAAAEAAAKETKKAPKTKLVKPAAPAPTAPAPTAPAVKPGLLGKAAGIGGKLVRGGGVAALGYTVGQAAYEGTKALIENTEYGQRIPTALADLASNLTGADEREAALLSEDPAVRNPAIAGENYKSDLRTKAQSGAPAPAGQPAGPTPLPARPGSTEEAQVAGYVAQNSVDAGKGVSAANPQAIPNTGFNYAGKYGDTEVLSRPTMGADGKPVIDSGSGPRAGQVVPEFTDQNTAFNRPGSAPSAEAQAAEAARVAQSRADYERNTTGSDGRRYYGGGATEELRAAQLEQARKGDADGTVARQLADEGLTPEQRAAYATDPVAAYGVDADANAAAVGNQLDAYKQQYTMQGDTIKNARLERSAEMENSGKLIAGLKTSNPASYDKIMQMAAEQSTASGQPMSSVVSQLLASLQMDATGAPVIGEDGNFVPLPIDTPQSGSALQQYL
jgi:hypothetical protein